MIKESVVVKADPGFDGRPIALLVQEASQYKSRIFIEMKQVSMQVQCIFRLEKSISMRRVSWG